MPITKPAVDAADYLEEDSEDIQPKVGTTVQKGWGAVDATMSNAAGENFPVDFKFSEEPQLIKFLEDEPFAVYEQHWIEAISKGKKSFVCVGDECPMCDILGDMPRGRFSFNVVVLSGDNAGHQILTGPPALVRQLRKLNEDDRKGPLSREYWEISRLGTGFTTTYAINLVKERDLEEEWKVSPETAKGLVATAVPFTAEVIRETPRSEMKQIARSVA